MLLIQNAGNLPKILTRHSQRKDSLYDRRCHRVRNQLMLILRVFDIPIRSMTGYVFSVLDPGAHHRLDLL